MGRAPRITEGGFVYYVVCRGLNDRALFGNEEDYIAFEEILQESIDRWEPRLLAYAFLANQWHLLAVPRKDGDLSKWVAWLTSVHAMRSKHMTTGRPTAGLYERRYRSFPVQENQRLLDAILWIERLPTTNPGVQDLLQWKYTSLASRLGKRPCEWLSQPPVAIPLNWEEQISQGLEADRSARLQVSIDRGAPYGDEAWVEKMAKRFHLESTLRPRGRPKKS